MIANKKPTQNDKMDKKKELIRTKTKQLDIPV